MHFQHDDNNAKITIDGGNFRLPIDLHHLFVVQYTVKGKILAKHQKEKMHVQQALREIESFDTIIIHRHSNPDGDALGSQIDNCCCSTKMEIANNRYDAERNASAIQAAVHAEGEATRALIQENKIEALQNKIQALELQSAMCGVVRYPTGTTYSAGAWPFGGSSCSPCYGGTTF